MGAMMAIPDPFVGPTLAKAPALPPLVRVTVAPPELVGYAELCA